MFRFRLRTMLIGVAVLCPVFAWVGYSLRWIEHRRALRALSHSSDTFFLPEMAENQGITAPCGLWIFGEEGVAVFWMPRGPQDRIEAAQRLFPEAKIETGPPPAYFRF